LFISNGQIGDGTSGTNRLLPVAVYTSGVLLGKNFLQITTGVVHTCVLANDRNIYCWGKNQLFIFFIFIFYKI
jgi:alpha-tubulin suppressor-like RCC1 family protein